MHAGSSLLFDQLKCMNRSWDGAVYIRAEVEVSLAGFIESDTSPLRHSVG